MDLSEFEQLSKPRSQCRPCVIATADLSPADRKMLEAACERPTEQITNKAVSLWLEARGHQATWQAIRQHRNRECGCFK